MIPCWVYGVLAWFMPYLYAFLPVSNSAICICEYFRLGTLDLLIKNSYPVLVSINVTSFFGFSFIFMSNLIYMVYKIRKIND